MVVSAYSAYVFEGMHSTQVLANGGVQCYRLVSSWKGQRRTRWTYLSFPMFPNGSISHDGFGCSSMPVRVNGHGSILLGGGRG